MTFELSSNAQRIHFGDGFFAATFSRHYNASKLSLHIWLNGNDPKNNLRREIETPKENQSNKLELD
jgi:hypothetical protein